MARNPTDQPTKQEILTWALQKQSNLGFENTMVPFAAGMAGICERGPDVLPSFISVNAEFTSLRL